MSIRGVNEGRLVVRQDGGVAFDATGAVYVSNGAARRDEGRKLTTLPMDEATLAAMVGSSAGTWLKVTGLQARWAGCARSGC